MKNVFLLFAVCCSLAISAGTYNYLVFTNQAGDKTAFSVEGLTLNVDGSTLQVTNMSGTIDVQLIDIVSMQFSNENIATGLNDVLNASAPVYVFGVSGVMYGSYGSLIEAAQVLQSGMYVISNGSVTQTVVIKN